MHKKITLEGYYFESVPFLVGCDMSDIDQIVSSIHAETNKPVCGVKDWLWLEETQAEGMPKVKIYSRYVLFDEHRRFQEGYWVFTSLLHSLHKEWYIFETANTVYLLVGDGLRKSIGGREIKEGE